MNLTQLTSKLTPKGWLAVGGAAAATLVFFYVLISMAGTPSYTTLMAGVDPAQTGKITSALSSAGIAYELQNNGTAIAVQSGEEAQARVSLATAGLLSGTGTSPSSAFQSFNNMSLGASNLQQQVGYQVALEQQLGSTIDTIQGVSSAQVQIAIPTQSDQLYSPTPQAPSASVLLADTGGLGSSQLRGIADLVANAVTGLNADKVTITDQTGQLLWPTSSSASTGLLATEQAQAGYDSQMAGQLNAMLASTLGAGKAQVQVSATLDANQITAQSVTYARKGTPLQTQTSKETLTGASPPSTTGTGIPAYAGGASGNSKYLNQTSTTNYGVDKTVSQTVVAPGKLLRQSVSVLVDKSVPASELASIKRAVEAAAGYQAKRGDTISVAQIAFAKLPAAAPAASSSTTKMLGYAKYVLVGLGALLFLFFTSRALRRRENESFAGTPTWLRELEAPRSLAAVEAGALDPLEPQAKVRQLRSPVPVAKQQIEDLIERDPDRVASQVRAWMNED